MIDVGGVGDFAEGAMRVVNIGTREIGILRWRDGEFFVFHNRCPHQGGPLCRGFFGPKIVGDATQPGRVDVDRDHPVVICPWHKWEFDARSGQAVWDENYRVRVYPVRVEGGRVLVGMRPPRASPDGE